MAEKSTFFNSVSGDRKYKAEDIAAHFAKLISNGVYPAGTQLQATEDAGMNVTVSAGSAWINGYAYHNDDDYTLTFDAADGVLNRIDRIVVRWGRLARSINLAVVKGTPGSSPSAPVIVRSADYYDLGIATVSIGAGITAITQAMITDTRLDSNVCGLVSSLIQPDTSGWFAQFNAAFLEWFEELEDILDENTAANLLNLINEHKADYVSQPAKVTATSESNVYTITAPAITAYVDYIGFVLKADADSTGAVTVNWSGKGAKALKTASGDDAEMQQGGIYTYRYNATTGNFILQGESGVKINALVSEYQIYAGENINAGDLVTFINDQALKAKHTIMDEAQATFENATSISFSATKVDTNKVLVAYYDSGATTGNAVILSISGTTITVGNVIVFQSSNTQDIFATTLSSSKVMVCYSANSSGNARILSISGTTITVNAAFVFSNTAVSYITTTALDSTRTVVAYNDAAGTNYGQAKVLTASGTTISGGTAATFHSISIQNCKATTVNTNKVILVYANSSNNGYTVALSISGTSVTSGSPVLYENGQAMYNSIAKLDTDKAICSYQEYNSGYIRVVLITVSGTTITVVTPFAVEAKGVTYDWSSICPLTTSIVLIVHTSSSWGCRTKIIYIDDATIRNGNGATFEESNFTQPVCIANDSNNALIAYQGTSSYGRAKLLSVINKAEGLALQNGTGGEIKKFYNWR